MLSVRAKKNAAAAVLTLAWVQPAGARPPVEDPQVVTRTVNVQREAILGDPKALARLNHELNHAARSACDELYPLALVYLTHLCVSETLDDARDQLNRLRSGQSASTGVPRGPMTVAVRAR